ncbi:MAG: cytochrome c oxidase subunit II [Zoogloea sp.]|nr:cytochrome c oxidase subunit II [Zoogloea sp.]
MNPAGLPKLAVSAILAAAAPAARAELHFNLQTPVTAIGEDIYLMHTLMLVLCLFIFIGVFGVMFWAVFHHRKSKGVQAGRFDQNAAVEVVWTVIPLLILFGMAWPASRTVLAMKDSSEADITIKVTGYQWNWGYDYLKGEGAGIRLLSHLATPRDAIEGARPKGEFYLVEVDQPLVVPVGRKIRILTTAADVIHSWGVPAFGIKQDAIPGFIRDTWFRAEREGIYRGNCVELCGKEHAFMPIVVQVVSPARYSRWVAAQAVRPAQSTSSVTQDTGRQGRDGSNS